MCWPPHPPLFPRPAARFGVKLHDSKNDISVFTEAEEKAKKEREEKQKSKPRPPPPTEPAAKPKRPAKKEGEEGDEMELDEDDLKIIQDTKKQGYCYFKRTLSEKDQSLLDAEQMKLRAVSNSPSTNEVLRSPFGTREGASVAKKPITVTRWTRRMLGQKYTIFFQELFPCLRISTLL